MASSSKSDIFDVKRQDSSSDDEEKEALREEDIRERDAYAKRLREREEEQTKKKIKTEPPTKTTERSQSSIEELRKTSRRDYLDKRKDAKVEELKAEIRDYEYLFKDVKLSEREKRELEHKKKTLQLALAHEEARKLESLDRYYMPTGKSEDTTKTDRYSEDLRHSDDKHNVQKSERQQWEDDVIHTALPHFGSRDKEAKSNKKTYDYILDEEIQFVQQLTIPGVQEILSQQEKDRSKSSAAEDESKAKHRKIQEARKTLPIYRFRNDLMKAIREHQVLIIEGETGSGKTSKF